MSSNEATGTPADRTILGTAWRVIPAVLVSLVIWGSLVLAQGEDITELQHTWFSIIDPALGIASLVFVLAYVRRSPVLVSVAAGLLVIISTAAIGPALLAVASVATRRKWREISLVGSVNVITMLFLGSIYPSSSSLLPWWNRAVIFTLVLAVVVAVGVAIGQRRAILDGLRERAEQAEREQEARAEAARVSERNRIAHDMHDVLAHRISLIALHSSALSFRGNMPEAEQAVALQTIADNARLALSELREVLGVLRQPSSGDQASVAPPQPLLSNVPQLVDESRATGSQIKLIEAVEGAPPLAVSQAAYRIVREALTNARKHAQGAPVVVSIAGEAGEGLALRVTNGAAPEDAAVHLPGSGLGLVALRERVELLSGKVNYGTTADGEFEIAAWLPWEA
ncbi:histidine kinase [Glutamicibacter sp.]|uniref:sensor histidine kinase n=1 Tax=Glutamicibacter sp. TaxID=1931995 RepID=UPI0028BEFCFC|nr:histidine kinase [Glutamicibacter sp.]